MEPWACGWVWLVQFCCRSMHAACAIHAETGRRVAAPLQLPPWGRSWIATYPCTTPACGSRFLWLALERPAWSPEQHRRFPPRFKRAVRTLLLASHRGRQPGGAEQRHLAAVPNELLVRILGHMAYPLSAWAPGALV